MSKLKIVVGLALGAVGLYIFSKLATTKKPTESNPETNNGNNNSNNQTPPTDTRVSAAHKCGSRTFEIYRHSGPEGSTYYAKDGEYVTVDFPSLNELYDYLGREFYTPNVPAPTPESVGLKPSSTSNTWWISGKNKTTGNGWGYTMVLGPDYPAELVAAETARGNIQVSAVRVEA